MTSERPTVRPVTLSRLVEVSFLAHETSTGTAEVEAELDVTNRRARETILEAERISVIEEIDADSDEEAYVATTVGDEFVAAVEDERWSKVDGILRARSPHYGAFVDVVEELGPLEPEEALEELEADATHTPYEYNETSLDVVGAWAQRLGVVQRNAFSGSFYLADQETEPANFPFHLITVSEALEETGGVNLQQRYLPIPELREESCERLGCPRSVFDEALVRLAEQNVGKLELSGAPIDTGAKEARFGIKTLRYADDDGIVSTEQSSEQVMRGVELLGKQYYYLAIHDENLTYDST